MNSSIRQQTNQIASAIEDIATLVGEYTGKSATLNSGVRILPGLGQNSDARGLQRRAQDIRQGLFTVAVMGRFKHGKSTLINAMLGKVVVQARTIPTTAVITVIAHGARQDVALYESNKPQPTYISWQDFLEDYCLQAEDVDAKTAQRFAHIDHAQIETQHPFVAQGIKLVDSPGLGEDDSRNETTKRFLKQAHAVIFVLDAIRLLSEDERRFIRQELGEGVLEHVFFVINRVNQIEQEGLGELTARLQKVLKAHFGDRNGQFDEDFFQRRVFLVDAKGALEARRCHPTDETLLQNSGLLRLESELSAVLISEARIRAVLASSVQALTGTLVESYRQIERQHIALRQTLQTLLQRRQRSEEVLRTLQIQKQELLKEIDEHVMLICLKVQLDLKSYLEQEQNEWSRQQAHYLPLTTITMGDLLQCAWNEAIKQKVIETIQDEIVSYVKQVLASWTPRLQTIVSDETTRLEAKIHPRMRHFQQALNSMQDEFVAGRAVVALGERDFALATLSFSYRTSMQNTGDWKSMIGSSVVALYGMLVLWVIGIFNPVVFGAAIVAALAGFNPFRIMEVFKNRIRTDVGNTLFQKLKSDDQLAKMIHSELTSHFAVLSAHLDELLTNRIAEAEGQIQQILARMSSSDFDSTQELQRLEQIGQLLEENFNVLSDLSGGKRLNLKGIARL